MNKSLPTPYEQLIEALRPFAMQADTMYHLEDKEKVCGVEVRHYRRAFKIIREHELAQRGHKEQS